MLSNLPSLSLAEQHESLACLIASGVKVTERKKRVYKTKEQKIDEEIYMKQGHRKTIIGDCPDWIY